MRDEQTVERQLTLIDHYLGVLRKHLTNPKVLEVLRNEDGKVFTEVVGEGLVDTGETMVGNAALTLICAVARYHNETVTATSPTVETELPTDGSRFTALIPPVCSSPVISIRKRALQVFPLASYVERGIMTESQAQTIKQAVRDHRNILVCGATLSGKSTLTNAVIAEISDQEPQARVVIIENTHELQCALKNKVILRTRPGVKDLRALVEHTLRLRPDRIIVGEIRNGGETNELLKAWGTGHPGGVSTIHAETAVGALERTEELLREVMQNPSPRFIASTVNYVISIQRDGNHPAGRRVKEIVRVLAVENGRYVVEAC